MSERNTYVGGPCAAAILGVNPFKTALAFWQDITGRAAPDVDGDPHKVKRRGRLLERAVLDYAAEELGERILPGPFILGEKHTGGHLDGVAEKSGDIVEAKTANHKRGWGEPGTAEVHPYVAAQSMHYLGLVPNAGVCWVPVLFSGGLEFAMYRVERDDALIATMRDICSEWWERYVVADMPPPPATGADVLALFPRDSGRVVVADDPTADAVALLRGTRAQIESLETQRDELESRIKLAMGDAATLTVAGEVAVTWKAAKASRFDSSALKAAQPETYKEFCREVSSRRFLVKG